ncbi:hypothetical protein BX666DRAFT_1894134 [Dichotomocladium elegans]|nr:hypothetical protein BX666DRAFT_1894134 [Dichotomocladium elegans]
MCWLRWYYVDAWLSLTRNRDCLLKDETPFSKLVMTQEDMEQPEFQSLYQFGVLTKYMRMYIQAIRSGKIYGSPDRRHPSAYYHQITEELTTWYHQRLRPSQKQHPSSEIHFHLCYHAMRLIVLFQFLQPTQSPPHNILIDCLETNLALLQALEHLKELGCDQSTYHHMFFAIHNTAKRVYGYSDAYNLRSLAEEQLRTNLMMLRGTQAYSNDVFKARLYVEKIEEQFRMLDIRNADHSSSSIVPSDTGFTSTLGNVPSTTSPSPRIVVFRQNDVRIRKKSASSAYSKKAALTKSRHQLNYWQASV